MSQGYFLFSPQRELKFLLNTVIHLLDIVGCVWRTLAKNLRSLVTVVEKHTVKTCINCTDYSLPMAANGLINKNFYNEKRAHWFKSNV